MAVTRKAKASTAAKPKRESIESSRRDHKGTLMGMISLRLPRDLISRVERSLKQQPGRISRNTYIINSIVSQLERDGS
jgi:hypothetical protein